MASASGTYKEGFDQQGNDSVSEYKGSSLHEKWSSEEQAILEEGLAKYASESNIICYVKIASQLKDKTVRDVAMRCRWMTYIKIGVCESMSSADELYQSNDNRAT